jgi:hypothetical protein
MLNYRIGGTTPLFRMKMSKQDSTLWLLQVPSGRIICFTLLMRYYHSETIVSLIECACPNDFT